MKRFFRILGRKLLVCMGCYIVGIFLLGFFPTQITTCCQLLTSCHYRICSWAPFIGTILWNVEAVWNWIHQFLPHFGIMCGVLIFFSMIKWVLNKNSTNNRKSSKRKTEKKTITKSTTTPKSGDTLPVSDAANPKSDTSTPRSGTVTPRRRRAAD